MRFVVFDAETYFDGDYTLKKLSTEAYIRDPRFEMHGCAIKWQHNIDAKWYDEKEFRYLAKNEDWSDVFLIAHHNQFDGLILSHHYDVHPQMMGCTLSMARLLLGNHISVSLDSVRKQFNLPAKITPYNLFVGKHWNELHPTVQQQVADGACDEVESIWKLFNILGENFPREEFEVIDTTVKMFTEPVIKADIDLLGKIWLDENTKKKNRLQKLHVTEADLQSADRFAALLRDAGVEPEMKQGKNGNIYAFAKTDSFMRDLLEDEDDTVKTLAEARLGVKSTLMQTRAETLGFMGSRGSLCVYLRYAGAGTLRPSGGDGTNFLNFKRGSPIRKTMVAPKGFKLGPVDASQIEFRVCMWLAGQHDVLELMRIGGDPYVDVASQFYGEKIYKPSKDDPRRAEMEAMRGMGKQGKLMCIYGAAGKQFKITAKNGLYGPPVDMTLEEANRFVDITRKSMPALCARNTGYWAQAGRMLSRLAGGDPVQWGPLYVKDHRIYLPNGCPLIYDTLEYFIPPDDQKHEYKEFERDGFWRVKTRQGWKTMWGSKLVQNICEAVSRVIVSQAMIRLKHLGYRTLNWPYDELLLLIPDDGRDEYHEQVCLAELRKTPDWLPGLPLDAEMIISDRYAK